MLTRISRAGIFASMSKLKSGVIKDAKAFAAGMGKVAIPLEAKETPVGGAGQWPMFEYQFRVVEPDHPEARRTSLVPRADVVIENNQSIKGEIKTKDETPEKRDIYGELMKLDDLRQKGIITDAELQAQKQKVLAGSQALPAAALSRESLASSTIRWWATDTFDCARSPSSLPRRGATGSGSAG